jgi:predicted HicB family RNase H-like nuclease
MVSQLECCLNRSMLIEYKNLHAVMRYCTKTKGYYGEIKGIDVYITFLASSKEDLAYAMQRAVDQYLLQQQVD